MRAVSSRVWLRGLSAINKRTKAAREIVKWRTELMQDLGGEVGLSAGQRTRVETKRRRVAVYWCRANRHGRRTNGAVCPNNLLAPMKLLDAALLGCIAPYLAPDVIGDAISEAMKRLGSRSAVATERARLEQELKAVDGEITHLLGFIKRGQGSEAVKQELGATEAKRKDLREVRDRLAHAEMFRSASGEVEVKLTAILKDWQDIRTNPVAQQRQLPPEAGARTDGPDSAPRGSS